MAKVEVAGPLFCKARYGRGSVWPRQRMQGLCLAKTVVQGNCLAKTKVARALFGQGSIWSRQIYQELCLDNTYKAKALFSQCSGGRGSV